MAMNPSRYMKPDLHQLRDSPDGAKEDVKQDLHRPPDGVQRGHGTRPPSAGSLTCSSKLVWSRNFLFSTAAYWLMARRNTLERQEERRSSILQTPPLGRGYGPSGFLPGQQTRRGLREGCVLIGRSVLDEVMPFALMET